jgi:flagellar protein FlaG
MVDAVASGGASSNMPGYPPAATTAIVSGQTPEAAPASAVHIPSGFVAVVPQSGVKVNLEQVHQNVQDAIGRLNDMLVQNQRGLSFAMDPSTKAPVITVTSSTTGEVIRQIPNQAVLDVAHNIDAIKGLLFNSIT